MGAHFPGLLKLAHIYMAAHIRMNDNTHIHDRALSQLVATNTHIHGSSLSWLLTPNTPILLRLLFWLGKESMQLTH